MTASVRLGAAAALLALSCAAAAAAQTDPASGTSQVPATTPPSHTSVVPDNAASRGVRVLQPEAVTGVGAAAGAAAPAPVVPSPIVPAPIVTPPPLRPGPAPIVQLCARPFPSADLKWDGAAKIDTVLTERLKTRQRVVVDLAQPYPERNAPPEALSRWFSEVQKGGGAVTVKQYCKAARGGLGSWLATLFGGGTGGKYRVARNYDVVLHADALDRVVTQVEFVPKSAKL